MEARENQVRLGQTNQWVSKREEEIQILILRKGTWREHRICGVNNWRLGTYYWPPKHLPLWHPSRHHNRSRSVSSFLASLRGSPRFQWEQRGEHPQVKQIKKAETTEDAPQFIRHLISSSSIIGDLLGTWVLQLRVSLGRQLRQPQRINGWVPEWGIILSKGEEEEKWMK